MKKRHVLGMLMGLILGGAVVADAQVFTPTFMPPQGVEGFGVYLVDAGDVGVEGRLWRGGAGGYDLAFRGGVLDLGDAALTLGAQLRNPLVLGTDPLELAFTVGAQGLIGDFDAVGIDTGLSAGAAFTQGNLTIIPYLHPRLALINGFGADDGFDLEVLADLGVDFAFSSGLSLRIGFPIGDEKVADWGIGLSWR